MPSGKGGTRPRSTVTPLSLRPPTGETQLRTVAAGSRGWAGPLPKGPQSLLPTEPPPSRAGGCRPPTLLGPELPRLHSSEVHSAELDLAGAAWPPPLASASAPRVSKPDPEAPGLCQPGLHGLGLGLQGPQDPDPRGTWGSRRHMGAPVGHHTCSAPGPLPLPEDAPDTWVLGTAEVAGGWDGGPLEWPEPGQVSDGCGPPSLGASDLRGPTLQVPPQRGCRLQPQKEPGEGGR